MLALPEQPVYLGTPAETVQGLRAERKHHNLPALWNKGDVFSELGRTFSTLSKGSGGFEEGLLQHDQRLLHFGMDFFGGRKYFSLVWHIGTYKRNENKGKYEKMRFCSQENVFGTRCGHYSSGRQRASGVLRH